MFLNSTFVIFTYVLFHRDAVPLARNNTVYVVSLLGCRSQFGKSWDGISDGEIQPTVIGDVQGNIITAEICQGSLRGEDCTDRRGEEQHEKGKLLLLMFLSVKWSSNRSSRPVRKRWNPKRTVNRTIDFVLKVSTFLVPKPGCDHSQNETDFILVEEGLEMALCRWGGHSGTPCFTLWWLQHTVAKGIEQEQSPMLLQDAWSRQQAICKLTPLAILTQHPLKKERFYRENSQRFVITLDAQLLQDTLLHRLSG